MSPAAAAMERVLHATTDPRDRCPKCGAQLQEIHARHREDPPEVKGRLLGWECPSDECGYRDMIRESFAGRRRA